MSTDLRITFDLLSNMATKYGYIAEDAETCGRAAPTELCLLYTSDAADDR